MDPVLRSLEELVEWLDHNGIAGWDPYDALGHPLLRACSRRAQVGGPGLRYWELALAKANQHPMLTRRLLGIRPQINAKAVGLLLSGWLRALPLGFSGTNDQAHLLAGWLADHAIRDYPGASWGYPFDWQSRVFIPKGTPSSVVTATCGQALLDYADRTGDKNARHLAHDAALFISEGLGRYEAPNGGICFSYTPLDSFQVHNASLMAAEYLLRAGSSAERDDWIILATRALQFTTSEQQDDGSFEYWANSQMNGSQIDHYHTGFVLRSLLAFSQFGNPTAAEALDRGWRFYRDQLFATDGRPLNRPNKHFPLDIHSCAEAILCPATLSQRYGAEAIALSESAARWTAAHMQNLDGSFAYRLNGDHLDRTPYLRWGQAWMFRALTELLGPGLEHGRSV